MKYFEIGNVSKRELYEALKTAGGLSPWNPTLEPTKIQAGVYTSPGSFVLQADFNGIIDDVSSSSKGTIIYFFDDVKRWGIISGEDKNKGVYQTLAQLQTAYPTATNGDYALIIATSTFFSYYNNQWVDTGSSVAPDSLRSTNNLNDLSSKSTARSNLDVFNKKETKDAVGNLLVDTTTIDFTYSNTVGSENITAIIKDNSINNAKIASNADIATSKIKQAIISPTLDIFANNDTQDIINNKAQGQITNLENLLNTRPVGASNGNVYYLTSQASAIPNYELLSFSPDNSPLDIESVVVNSTTLKADRLIHSYIANYEVGATVISGGNWLFNMYGYVSHLNSSRFEIDVLKRTSGGVETLLFTCETTDFLQLSQQANPELNVANVEKTQQDFACNTSDKIVIKIYGKTDRSQDTTITLLHSGTDFASHIHTPLIASHNNLAGTQGGNFTEKYHLTLSDYNKVGNIDNLLLTKEDVVNKTTSFSATPANIKYPTEKLVKDNLDLKVDKINGKGLSTEDYTTAEKTKLSGIASGATANQTDSYLLARANHTGTQAISTITDLSTNLSDKFSKTASGEISTLVDKTTVVDTDVVLIEDSSTSFSKKKITALNNYNYINNKLASQFNAKVGIANNETITGSKTFSSNITLNTIPADVNHLARIKDVQDYTTAITAQIGQVNGIASLGNDGKVPASQLPAYVDDVLEYDNFASFPATGEAGKIYVAKDNNKTYRWSGTQYIEISPSLALGETSSTAYRGDLGKIAYDHSQLTGNPHSTTKTDVGLGNVDNTSDLNKPISTATQTALNDKFSKSASNEIAILTAKSTLVNNDVVLIEDSSTSFSKKKTTVNDIATLASTKASNRKMVFLSLSGDDTRNGYSQENAVQTLSQALTLAGNSGNQIEVLPAVYTGDYTISQLNVSISGSNIEGRGICSFSGTLTSSNASSSQLLQGLTIGKVVHSSTGSLYLRSSSITGIAGSSLVASGNGYLDVDNVDFGTGTIAITGSGNKNFNNSKGGILTVNNANAIVNLRNALTLISPTLTAGTLSISNCPIYSTASGSNAITTSAGSILYLSNVSIVNPDGTNARINIPAGAFYSFNNVIFDRINSTILGTNLNREANFDKVIASNKQDTINDGNKINTIASDVASSGTLNLDSATGDIVNITGTTTITAITLSAGVKRFVRFAGVLTLTNGANLVLPSGANITTAVGDTAIFIGYGSSLVRCVSYTRVNGTALVGGGAGSGDVSSIETSATDSQLVLFSGTDGKTIKKSTDNGFVKVVGGVVNTQSGVGGGEINIASSTLNNFVAVGNSGTIVDSGKKINNTATPTDNDIWTALKTKTYVDSSLTSDTVYTTSLAYGTGVNLDVSNNKFSIITVTDGDAFATLPDVLNNSGKKMAIRSATTSIGRLYINGSEKGSNKYYLLSDDTAIFECDGTAWRLLSGPNYIVPYFGKFKQSSARGCVFVCGNNIYGLGRGNENQTDAISGAYSNIYTPTPLQLYNSDGTTYYDVSTISGFADIVVAHNFAMALTNEGIVFQWGANYAGINGAVRNPRKINFPNNELIESIYMAGSNSNSFFEIINTSSFYAISRTGKVYSWGYQESVWKNLGHNDAITRYTPTLITAIQDKRMVKLAISGNYGVFCAGIDDTGQLYTWGYNGNPVANGNPLGNNVATADTPTGVPTAVAGFTDVVDIIAIGGYSNVAGAQFRGYIRILRADGSTWASGYNGLSNLGISGTTSYRVFTRESTNRNDIFKLGTSCSAYTHPNSIVITNSPDSKVYFAGYNEKGWMGRGDYIHVSTFTLNATQLSVGFQGNMYDYKGINCQAGVYGSINGGYPQGIVLDGNGKLWTSGDNTAGTCGDGTRADRNTWFQVKFPTNRRVVDLHMVGWYEATDRGIIVVFEDGTMMSWGNNTNGALGNSTYSSTISYPIPRWVIGFDNFNKNK